MEVKLRARDRQYLFFLPIDPRDKSHKNPDELDLNVPRRAQYLHNAWKRHQDAVFWDDIDLAIRKRFKYYQTRSNAMILQETLPAHCIPKVVRLKTGEVLYEKSYMSPRHHQRSHYDTITIGPEGMMNWVLQLNNNQSINSFNSGEQPKPKPISDRSGKPDSTEDVFVVQGKMSHSHEMMKKVCTKNLVLQIDR